MSGTGRYPGLRVDQVGSDEAAKQICDRIYRRNKGRHWVFLLDNTGVVLREKGRAEDYPRGRLVGDFDKGARWQDVAIAIRLTLQRPVVKPAPKPVRGDLLNVMPGMGGRLLGAIEWAA